LGASCDEESGLELKDQRGRGEFKWTFPNPVPESREFILVNTTSSQERD